MAGNVGNYRRKTTSNRYQCSNVGETGLRIPRHVIARQLQQEVTDAGRCVTLGLEAHGFDRKYRGKMACDFGPCLALIIACENRSCVGAKVNARGF